MPNSAQTSAPSRGHGAGRPSPWPECASVIDTFYFAGRAQALQWRDPADTSSPCRWLGPRPHSSHPSGRATEKEAKWPTCSQVPPHPATRGLVPLSAGPCSVAPGPTRPTSFPSNTRLSRPGAASLPERESPALPVSIPAREALCARLCFTKPLGVWLLRKVWLLTLPSGLPGRAGDAGGNQKAREVSWRPVAHCWGWGWG